MRVTLRQDVQPVAADVHERTHRRMTGLGPLDPDGREEAAGGEQEREGHDEVPDEAQAPTADPSRGTRHEPPCRRDDAGQQ
ncbi:MAG: hypothetical protein KJ066_03785 [Acidobacteria bacterium]|nr:hypothetical protein [Acidobacteriota bacterium]